MSTLLALNPRSRCGDSDPDRLVEVLQPLGPVLLHNLVDGPPLESVVERLGDELDRLLIGGGDGTLNRALPAIRKAGKPVGIVPLGTANDFARSLQLPTDPEDALRVVVEGHTQWVGVGYVNGEPFLNAVSVGIGPELNKALGAERKKQLGVAAYLATLIDLMGRERSLLGKLTLDGAEQKIRFMQITIANSLNYGGGLTVTRDAGLNDGRLQVLWLPPQSKMRMLAKAAKLRWGADGVEAEGLKVYAAREVKLDTKKSVEFTADGELIGSTPLTCTVERDVFEVYVPAEVGEDLEPAP